MNRHINISLGILFIASTFLLFGEAQAQNQNINQIRALTTRANVALTNSNWNLALESINEAQKLAGQNVAAFELVRIRAYFGKEEFIQAKRSLDTFYGLSPNQVQINTVASYASNIDSEIKKERDRIARLEERERKRRAEEAKENADYNGFIQQADAAFRQNEFNNAERLYKEALKVKSTESYPKTQLENIKTERARIKREAEQRRLREKIAAINVPKEGLNTGLKHQKRFLEGPYSVQEVSTSAIVKSKKLFSNSNRVYFSDRVSIAGGSNGSVISGSSGLTVRYYVFSNNCNYQYGNPRGTAVDIKIVPSQFSSRGVSFSLDQDYYINKYVHGCREKDHQNKQIGDLSGQVLSFMQTWTRSFKNSKGSYISFTNDEKLAYEKNPSAFKSAYLKQFYSGSKVSQSSLNTSNRITEEKKKIPKTNFSSLSEYKGKWMVSYIKQSVGQQIRWRDSIEKLKSETRKLMSEGYYLADFEAGGNQWNGIYSVGTVTAFEILEANSTSGLGDKISASWDKGFSMTDVEYYNGTWYAVMVKGLNLPKSGYSYRDSYDKFTEAIKTRFNDGYALTAVEYGNGVYFGLFQKKNTNSLAWNSFDTQTKVQNFITKYTSDNYGILSISPLINGEIFIIAEKTNPALDYEVYNTLDDFYKKVKPDWYDKGYVVRNVEYQK